MQLEITPEPNDEERQAILAALESEDADHGAPLPWRRAGLGAAEEEDQAAGLPRQSRGAARA